VAAYVYLIEEQPHPGEASGPWTKIGYSQNPPEWRMDANLKRGNPRNIRVATAFEYETNQGARAAELGAHRQFRDNKHQKEWFNVAWTEISDWMIATGAKVRVPDSSSDA
jgi:hypothetical protein